MIKLNLTLALLSLAFVGCDISSSSNEGDLPDTSIPDTTPQTAVMQHNQIRFEVFDGSEVVWNEGLAASAFVHANYLASTGTIEHDSNTQYGENIYASTGNIGYTEAINSWYSEKVNYDYANNRCSGGECLHYTQIVWKETTEIGCATSTYTTGEYKDGTVVVCRYNPPGNFIGETPY